MNRCRSGNDPVVRTFALEMRDILRDTHDGPLPGRHVEFRVTCPGGAFDLRKEQIARGLASDEVEVVIPPRQNPVGEDQQIRVNRIGPDLLLSELQDAPYLGRTGEIRDDAQIDLSSGLAVSAPGPRSSPPPDHGTTITPVQVVELELGPGRRVRWHGRLLTDEVREQPAGNENPWAGSRYPVRAGAGEQHCRFAGTIGAGRN